MTAKYIAIIAVINFAISFIGMYFVQQTLGYAVFNAASVVNLTMALTLVDYIALYISYRYNR